jgi:hypothetical protein
LSTGQHCSLCGFRASSWPPHCHSSDLAMLCNGRASKRRQTSTTATPNSTCYSKRLTPPGSRWVNQGSTPTPRRQPVEAGQLEGCHIVLPTARHPFTVLGVPLVTWGGHDGRHCIQHVICAQDAEDEGGASGAPKAKRAPSRASSYKRAVAGKPAQSSAALGCSAARTSQGCP